MKRFQNKFCIFNKQVLLKFSLEENLRVLDVDEVVIIKKSKEISTMDFCYRTYKVEVDVVALELAASLKMMEKKIFYLSNKHYYSSIECQEKQ